MCLLELGCKKITNVRQGILFAVSCTYSKKDLDMITDQA